MLKRYLLFVCSDCYPMGGWDDFHSSWNTLEEAKITASQVETDYNSWHIVDIQLGKIVV